MSGTIARTKAADPGLDYELLVAEGTALVQRMSGQIWTDYNYSDPGVTMLEQLCYALTELSYRAGYPVADLLGDPVTGKVIPMRQGLYPARAIMPINPVTAADLRRLIIDRVRHVGNVWFTMVTVNGVSGLYQVDVLIPGLDPDCCRDGEPNPATVLRRVLDCAAAHRGLCEDVYEARVLTPLPTRVAGEVQIADHADPDAVMADLLFRVRLFLSPEPKRQSLDTLIKAGKTTSEIFTGPLMLRGFIADPELTDLPETFSADQLLEVMAETGGVLSVEHLRVQVFPNPDWYAGPQPVTLLPGTIARLAAEASELRLMRGTAVCPTNPVRVRRLLDRLWNAQRRTYDLWPAYATEYPAPVGAASDLAAYTSVQDQFPAVYGIGEAGLPSGADVSREALARQLKGYLMPFDQLMANYFSQLAFVRDLFSPAAGGSKTYAFQSLRPIVPNVAPLLQPGYLTGLATLMAASDPVTARQADILGLLLSLYGERLMPPGPPPGGADAVVKARRALLKRVVPATRDRGRGFDYRHGGPTRGYAGMEIRTRIELELLESTGGRTAHGLAEPDPDKVTFGQRLHPAHHEIVERGFMPLGPGGSGDDRDEAASPLAGHHVAPDLLAVLDDPARYRIGKLPDHDGAVLVCQDANGGWWVIAHYDGAHEAATAAHHLIWMAGGARQRLTIVEWTLLRFALPLLDGCDPSAFSFRISAVMASGWKPEDNESAWRQRARAILRENTPAHIVLNMEFLGRHQMREFEHLHREWLRALRYGPADRKAETSRDLALFLGLPERFPPEPEPEPPPEPEAPDPLPPPEDGQETGADDKAGHQSDITTSAAVLPELDVAAREAHLAAFRERLRGGRRWALPVGDTAVPGEAPSQPSGPGPEPKVQPPRMPEPVVAVNPPQRRWWQRFLGKSVTRAEPKPAQEAHPDGPAGLGRLLVQTAAPGIRGFDTDTVLNQTSARAFAANGFHFAIRYLSRVTPGAAGDLTEAETKTILDAGLALMAVQHCALRGWTPTEALGERYGAAAAANAALAGLPRGINLWLDLEGVKPDAPPADVIAYCNAWHVAVAAAGYLPGLYIGAGQVLTGDQLYFDLRFAYYWKPVSAYVPDVAVRGQCMTQTMNPSFVLGGVSYDEDVTETDAGGNTPVWAVLLRPDGGA